MKGVASNSHTKVTILTSNLVNMLLESVTGMCYWNDRLLECGGVDRLDQSYIPKETSRRPTRKSAPGTSFWRWGSTSPPGPSHLSSLGNLKIALETYLGVHFIIGTQLDPRPRCLGGISILQIFKAMI